jgi:hypothetical protein
MRLLRAGKTDRRCGPRPERRVYNDAVREPLIVAWEASDRICGKRLRSLLPIPPSAFALRPRWSSANLLRNCSFAAPPVACSGMLGQRHAVGCWNPNPAWVRRRQLGSA